jgi:hypothetical protein
MVVCGLRSSLSCWALREMENCDCCGKEFDGDDLYDHDGARCCLACHLEDPLTLVNDEEAKEGLPQFLSMSLILQIAILRVVGVGLLGDHHDSKDILAPKTIPKKENIYVRPPSLTLAGKKSMARPCFLYKGAKFGKQAIAYIVRIFKEYPKKRREAEEKRVKDAKLKVFAENNQYITDLLRKVIQTPIPFSEDGLMQVPSTTFDRRINLEEDALTFQFKISRKQMLEYLKKPSQPDLFTPPLPSTDFLEKFDSLLANTTTEAKSDEPQDFLVDNASAILQYRSYVCPDHNSDILLFVEDKVLKDPTFIPRKPLHKTMQAGAISFGKRFKYRSEDWAETDIPPVFARLLLLAHRFTNVHFDIVLLKVYIGGGESLARHQDVDGSKMTVACFTFASDTSQLRRLQFFGGGPQKMNKHGKLVWTSKKVLEEFCPEIGSMWYMSGSTNSEYSHSVLPAEDVIAGGIRVSVSLRLHSEQPKNQ